MGIIPTLPYDHQSPECLSSMLLLSLAFSSELLFSQFPDLLQHCFQEDLPKKQIKPYHWPAFRLPIFSLLGLRPSQPASPSLLPFIPEFFSRLATPSLCSVHTSLHHSLEWPAFPWELSSQNSTLKQLP